MSSHLKLTPHTSDSPVTGDDASSLAESESLMGGASGSSLGGGGGGSSVDIAEGSSLGIPDEDLAASDVSVGKDDCMLNING